MPHREKQVHIPAALASEAPAARAWIIASAMPKASRAAVIAACRKVGIPLSVAAAQVQRQRYGQEASRKARELPKRALNMLRSAASQATEVSAR